MMNTFFLQASPNAGIMQLVLLGGMIVVFYFFMIRPQAQKAKKAKKFQDDLQKGDKIVDRKSTRLNSSHVSESRMPSSA